MTFEYITAALEHARYEIIEDAEPYYGEVPELPGVWATGRTLEECRRNPAGVIDERPINGSGAGSRSPGWPATPWERAPGWIPVPEHRIRP
ncbi:MAG TPA: type II toxin-antitoxin system HicB family antitoxin, partial [Methanoculleus sp.]|nr:type II toxin-antitoxin system HicB family antitoxin [Methanoculleus sp.]